MEKRDVSLSELQQMAEGARPEEFGVDLHDLRRRELNKLPKLDSIDLPLSEEEQRDISVATMQSVEDKELKQMAEGARPEEYGVHLRKREVLALPKEGTGVTLELSEEEARDIDRIVHPRE